MTPGEAFEKAAMDRFQEVKMASLGTLLTRMGGGKGVWNALTEGNLGKALGSGMKSLADADRSQLYGQLAGAGAGLVGGMFLTDRKDSPAAKLLVPLALAGGGYMAGPHLGKMIHDYRTA
jgi:hypothetical protein